MQHFLKFSTDVLPERDRVAIWSDVFGRYILKQQLKAAGSEVFSQHATLRQLPGLSLASTCCSGFHTRRGVQEVADGSDQLTLIVNVTGTSEYRQLGRETLLAAQQAVLISGAEQVEGLCPGASRALVISSPRETIGAMTADPEAMLCRALPPGEPLGLLVS